MSNQTLDYTFRGNDNTVTTALPVTAKAANYTVNASDDVGREFTFDTSTSDLTVSLPTASTAGNGFNVILRNIGTGVLTIDPSGTETIDGELTEEIQADEVRWIRCDGLSWRSVVGIDASTPTSGASAENILINGDFAVAQRGTSFDATTISKNDDDTYLLDRWVLLSDGNDIVDVDQIETAADLPTGARAAMKYTWETANKQAGLLQIVEGINARPAIGGPVSLSFQAKASGLANLRAVVLSWGSTEDTVTSDVVTTWNGAGTNPTFATNWTAENTPSDLALSTSWETFTIENVSVDTANTKNIAVFIWLDDTDAAINDTLFVTNVKFEVGEAVTGLTTKSFADELAYCQRYFTKTYGYGILIGTLSAWGSELFSAPVGSAQQNYSIAPWRFAVEMRIEPSVTMYSPKTGAVGKLWIGASTATDVDAFFSNASSAGGQALRSSGPSVVAGDQYHFHAVADAEL